ncbi:TatD family deoxyribonuclease, partial [Candidatus Woesearchaeota archaeon CG08_land_8_20_14_0_20_43_7]
VDEEIRFIEKQKDQIIAIGEVGLDYNWIKDRCDEQKDTFSKIIRLAEKIKKPIIVHSRKAEIDILDMLESSRLKKVVLHCFCGRSSLVKRAVDDGYSFSIPANIVRDMHFQKIAAEIPTNQILTETDAPFLSPFRGKRNEPAFISESLKKISELRGLTVEETSNLIYLNYQRMFL